MADPVIAAPASAPVEAPTKVDAVDKGVPDVQAKAAPDDEIDLGDGQKFKKSEIAQKLKAQKEIEKASHERFRQAAEIRKKVEAYEAAVKSGEISALFENKEEFEKALRKEVEKRVKLANMTDEQREAQALKEKLASLEKEREEAQKQEQAKTQEALVSQYENAFAEAFMPAMEQAGLPKSWDVVGRMAAYCQAYLEEGLPPPIPEIAKRVKKDLSVYTSSLIRTLPVDEAEAMLGKEFFDSWRKQELARVQAKPKDRPVVTSGSGNVPKAKISQQQWNQRFKEL